MKSRCKETIVFHSVRLSRDRRKRRVELEARYAEEKRQFLVSRAPGRLAEMSSIKVLLGRLAQSELEGARVRARVRFLEEEEQSSQFFIGMDRRRGCGMAFVLFGIWPGR